MASGTITSLGVGSGLQLQDILDQLRAVDEQPITTKKDSVTTLESQLNEFTVVNNNLLTMKSSALDLSLSSTFLGRTVTSSDESVLAASVVDSTAVQNTSVTVDRLASKSTWMTGGVASEDSIVYVPTSQESTTGVTDPAVDAVASTDGTIVLTFGGTDTITVDVGPTAGVTTMVQLVNAINNDAENVGGGDNGRLVTASTYQGADSKWYLKMETDFSGGTGEANRVAITSNDTDLAFSPPSKTFSYQVGSETYNLDIAADTTLNQLVDQVNDDSSSPPVTASVIDDGSATDPYKLVLQSDSTGSDNEITNITQLPDITLAVQSATGSDLNAQVTMDGVSYQRQSNTISDVLSGITMNLQGAGTSTLSVANNDENLAGKITDFVTAYNDAVQEIKTSSGYDTDTSTFGILAGTTIPDLSYGLENIMTTSVKADSTSTVTSLFDLGFAFNRDGTITIDTAVLDNALASSPDAVSSFFLGDSDAGITGFADQVNGYLRELTGGTGQIAAEKTGAQARIDDLDCILKRTRRGSIKNMIY